MSAVQEAPEPGQALTGFPELTVPARETMYRAHSAGRDAWWFDNGDDGRFNLHGDRGTCCTATTIDTAVRERVRGRVSKTGVVSPRLADTFVVSAVTSPLPYRCAAVGHVDAVRHGIVRELTTMQGYGVPQQWAAAFDEAGFEGVFYGSAYTTGEPSAYALFGTAGAPEETAGYHETRVLSGPEACRVVGWSVPTRTGRGIDEI